MTCPIPRQEAAQGLALMPTTFLFLHIPKTGGTSLRLHFEAHLRPFEEVIHLSETGEANARAAGFADFKERQPSDRNKARVIIGHDVNVDTGKLVALNSVETICVLREPVDWIVSRYNQEMRKHERAKQSIPSFWDWYWFAPRARTQVDWLLLRFLGLSEDLPLSPTEKVDRAVAALSALDHVWRLEDLAKQSLPVMRALGIPPLTRRENVTGETFKRFVTVDDVCNGELIELTQPDRQLISIHASR
jgi:Sulfotransferase family